MAEEVVERSEVLKRWALELGFDRAGVAQLGPVETESQYREWLARGDHAEMGYMASAAEKRSDPRRLFEGAASAVCVALVYSPLSVGERPTGDLWSGVARYAGGRDYHNLMGKRLRKLAKRIREAFPGAEARPYVDTGPILERDLAAAAGLGAVGKNTMLLHPEGSYFFIGEVLTSLELQPDQGMADLCGSCTLCLEACPTGALPEPYRLDSRACISYWTIEHRGLIPDAAERSLEHWVFGCDVCQEVCPHNGPLAAEGRERDFDVPPHRAHLGLVDLLHLTGERYEEVFQGCAMKRARPEGLRRNAAIAMGNSGDRQYLRALQGHKNDPDPVVRQHVERAIEQLELSGEGA